MTIRRALAELVNAGLARTVHGSGTVRAAAAPCRRVPRRRSAGHPRASDPARGGTPPALEQSWLRADLFSVHAVRLLQLPSTRP
jgi:hypothetical protein